MIYGACRMGRNILTQLIMLFRRLLSIDDAPAVHQLVLEGQFHGTRMQRLYGKQSRTIFRGNKESYENAKDHSDVAICEFYRTPRSEGLIKNLDMFQKNSSANWKIHGVLIAEIKGQSSSSKLQNVAFVSSKNTSSTNEAVNTAHEVSTASSQG
ncbi:hypothetical protein Tco_0944051 [Tanacetum coccineum]